MTTSSGSLLSEAIQQTKGVTVDHTKWTSTSIGNGKYVMIERTDNTEPWQSGGASLALNAQTISLAFENKSNKTSCEMCSMCFDKASMEYRYHSETYPFLPHPSPDIHPVSHA